MCEHLDFQVNAKVARLTDEKGTVNGYSSDINVYCLDCGQSFEFIGLPMGFNMSYPTTNVDATELRCPIRPSDSTPDNRLAKQKQN